MNADEYTERIHGAMRRQEEHARQEALVSSQEGWRVAYEATAALCRMRAENERLRVQLEGVRDAK